jgi:predicted DNA binding CopG/RHH family protein
MKKATDHKPGRMITRTIEQIENRRITKAERERLKRVAALPDDQIDTSDNPEVKDRVGWVRVHEHPEHPLHRVLSRLLSIRLPEPDIALAQRLAESKGLPYQTYIKSLLHEALEHERTLAERK